jgi:hypothetical protein
MPKLAFLSIFIFSFWIYCLAAPPHCTYEYIFGLDSIAKQTYRVPHVYSRGANCNKLAGDYVRGELGDFKLTSLDTSQIVVLKKDVIRIMNSQNGTKLQIAISSFKRKETKLKSIDTLEFRKLEIPEGWKGKTSRFVVLFRKWEDK